MITVKQAADALGLTPQRIRALIQAGRFPSAVRVGTERGPVWKIDPVDLDRPDIQNRPGGRPRRPTPADAGAEGAE